MDHRTSAAQLRAFHAKLMAVASGSPDDRLERIFDLVPREAFLGPDPWHVFVNRRYVETPSADPVYLYQNILVALDAAKGINNGEPFLHAAWIGAVGPKSGETIVHVGCGTGYYTAILSMLALPNGSVHAFEIDDGLAQRAAVDLAPFEGITLVHGDATRMPLPDCNLIYVNAGVVSPPASWLDALRPSGRIIFPWSPAADIGVALLLTRAKDGFDVRPLMPSWFIPCVGASDLDAVRRHPPPRRSAPSARHGSPGTGSPMKRRSPSAGKSGSPIRATFLASGCADHVAGCRPLPRCIEMP